MIKRYSKFVSNNPYIILAIVIVLTIVALSFQGNVGTKNQDNRDTLPDDIDVVNAFEVIEDNFGGSDSIMIAIQIDPQIVASNEIRDLRDYRAISYIDKLSQSATYLDDVEGVTSASTQIKALGKLPKSTRELIKIFENNPYLYDYISEDTTTAKIDIRLSGSYDSKVIVSDLQSLISEIDKPNGLLVNVAGDVATDPVMQEQIGPDMQKTSQYSMMGILLVLFLLFFSVKYALTPLAVIGIGITWAFGFFGIMGMNLSPATSGAISMIMGIGIDFGIQTITRFRQEIKKNAANKAMQITLNNVLLPMTTTTLAALIGFQAMSMGDLKVMQELAEIMSYGVLFCYLSAITVVPVVAVLSEKLRRKSK